MTGWRSGWLSPRRVRFWLLVAGLLYVLSGFLLAPWIVERQLVRGIDQQLGLTARIDNVAINPLALSARLDGFELADRTGSKMIGFESLYLNFQMSSLFRWAWTFRQITIDRPYIAALRDPAGRINLAALQGTPAGTAQPPGDESREPARLVIGELRLIEGIVDVTDAVPAPPFETRLGPISIALHDISTLPEVTGQKRLLITTENDTSIELAGDLQLNPLLVQGHVAIDGPQPPLIFKYFRNRVRFDWISESTRIDYDYRIETLPDGRVSVAIDNLSLVLRDQLLRSRDRQREFLRISEFTASGGRLRWPEQSAGFASIEISGTGLEVWRDERGMNLAHLFSLEAGGSTDPPIETAAANQPDAPAARGDQPRLPWSLQLDALRVRDLDVRYEDLTLESPAVMAIEDLVLDVQGITSETGARIPFESAMKLAGGAVRIAGTAGVLPDPLLDARLQVDGLPVAAAQPYVSEYATLLIEGGHLSSTHRIRSSPDEDLQVTGALAVDGLTIVDTRIGERLVGWEHIGVDGIDYRLNGGVLEVGEITVIRPYGRVMIAADGTSNLEGLVRERPGRPSSENDNAAGEQAMSVAIGRFHIDNGSADFSDQALVLPFSAAINEIDGTIAPIVTASAEPATVELEGTVNEFGHARIEGTLRPLEPARRSDLRARFRNIAMSGFTPYTAEFAGRRIDEGKLDLDLQYRIEDGQLNASNHILIDELTLGDKVNSPNAADLPLDLAIALLKDASGRIDLDLPVSGNVNQPDFSYAGLVWDTLGSLIVKAAASPFRLLGSLVGYESEDLDHIEFDPGRADLAAPEREKIIKLAEALRMRPQLGLVMQGTFDPAVDRPALQRAALLAREEAGLAGIDEDSGSLIDRSLIVLEGLYQEAFPDAGLDEFRSRHMQQPASPGDSSGEAAQTLDRAAYLAGLRRVLADTMPVGDPELKALAERRAVTIRQALVADSGLEADRLRAGETVQQVEAAEDRVPLPLEIGNLSE